MKGTGIAEATEEETLVALGEVAVTGRPQRSQRLCVRRCRPHRVVVLKTVETPAPAAEAVEQPTRSPRSRRARSVATLPTRPRVPNTAASHDRARRPRCPTPDRRSRSQSRRPRPAPVVVKAEPVPAAAEGRKDGRPTAEPGRAARARQGDRVVGRRRAPPRGPQVLRRRQEEERRDEGHADACSCRSMPSGKVQRVQVQSTLNTRSSPRAS